MSFPLGCAFYGIKNGGRTRLGGVAGEYPQFRRRDISRQSHTDVGGRRPLRPQPDVLGIMVADNGKTGLRIEIPERPHRRVCQQRLERLVPLMRTPPALAEICVPQRRCQPERPQDIESDAGIQPYIEADERRPRRCRREKAQLSLSLCEHPPFEQSAPDEHPV